MLSRLYPIRFELLLISQLAILFGSLVIPEALLESFLKPIFFLLNLLAGVLLLSNKPRLMWFLIFLLGLSATVFVISNALENVPDSLRFFRVAAYFLFYLVVTYEILHQVWMARVVGKNVIYGLISGYISLGLIGFFICFTIELAFPGSFQGVLLEGGQVVLLAEKLMYFSFITLMTIGYGDVLPVTDLAQKAAMLIGLIGQFYLVIITAVVVGKFIAQKKI